jgi:hypothetical protein
MILDNFLQFTNPAVVTAAGAVLPGDSFATGGITATGPSTNIIDLHLATGSGIPLLAAGQGARDIGIGDDPAMKLLVEVVTPFTTITSLSVALQGAPDNGSGAPGTFVTWWISPAYALATLTQGARLMDMDMPRPPDGVSEPRFLQLNYTIVGAVAASAGGTIRAFIVLDRHDQFYNATNNAILGGYPPGIVIAN